MDLESFVQGLNDLPWYTYRLAALVLLLGAALYYQLAYRRKSRLDSTICVSFFLSGAMLAVQTQVEEAGLIWSAGMWIAEAICLGTAVSLAVAELVVWVRRRRRAHSPSVPVLRFSQTLRERVGVGATSSPAEGGRKDSMALVPLEYRFSQRGYAVFQWHPDASGEPDVASDEEIRVPMNWN